MRKSYRPLSIKELQDAEAYANTKLQERGIVKITKEENFDIFNWKKRKGSYGKKADRKTWSNKTLFQLTTLKRGIHIKEIPTAWKVEYLKLIFEYLGWKV